MKISYIKKLRAEIIQGMSATIRPRIFVFTFPTSNYTFLIRRAQILPVVLFGWMKLSVCLLYKKNIV